MKNRLTTVTKQTGRKGEGEMARIVELRLSYSPPLPYSLSPLFSMENSSLRRSKN